MRWKGANRLYSRQALERWSERLGEDWEKLFPERSLRQGRNLYKSSAIREVSLNDDDAIMTCRVGQMDSYSVIEWESGRMNVRSSNGDAELGQAIAVAGLLEIEELLADEDLAMILGSGAEVAETAADEQGQTPEPARPAVPSRPSRMLHLVLDTHFKGLICEAFWLEADGKRAPALGREDGAPRAGDSEERGRLILLAARARKSHFVYSAEFGGYLLQNLREIAFFVQNVWPGWKRWFSTEERENIRFLRAGGGELEVGARVRLNERGKLDLRWTLDSGRSLLSAERAKLLLDNPEEPKLIPDLGIVRLSEASRRLMEGWKELEAEKPEREGLSPYLLFSLFAAHEGGIELSEDLREWREKLLGPDRSAARQLPAWLRPYQAEGVRWMSRLIVGGCHCLLADEMGLGKTAQVIALLQQSLEPGQRALVVCPASVVPVWIAEFAKFAPEISVGRREQGAGEAPQVGVISFALLRSRVERVAKEDYEFVVIDEAQFIKNPDSKASRSCRRLKARKRIALTGTPLENKPLDLWPTFEFLMPGLLGGRAPFERRYAENPGAFKARLRAQIAPFMLRRTKDAVARDLPEKTVMDLVCPMTPRQTAEYARICDEGLRRLGSDFGKTLRENRFATLSLLTRLRQVSCDPDLLPWVSSHFEDSGKLMVLLEKLIEVLGTGHKVVIFSQFVRFLRRAREMIETSFPDLPIFELTGATVDREAPVRDFQASSETAAMLLSLKAAGVGITLHSADYVFVLDPWWNPAVESQAIDRVHRIGQERSVFVYRLVAEGSVEERIQAIQREKGELFRSVVEGEGAPLPLEAIASSLKSLEALVALAQRR